MKVQYFTFVLNPTDQKTLFNDKRNKVEILKDVLFSVARPLKFNAHGMTVALLSEMDLGEYGIFRIGKHETVSINLSPEEKFNKTEVSNWPHCYLLLNFDDSPQGHQIAFEYKSDIFREPYVQLKELAKELNPYLFSHGYAIEINAVTTQMKFWDTIKENENKIKKLVLSFNSPNFLKLNTKLSDALKEIEKDYGSTKTTVVLENPEGKLKVPETELIKQGAEYITKGQGSYQLQIKTQKSYIKDKDNIETKEVIDINLETDDKSVIIQILNKIFKKNA